ncbi:hypothetical protein CCACVL1_19573 [Corchorus capsularis]|uniref:Uncharacterized protein n=1 Tax=Corchorus capsularis TaxID=210143 RepID=A0A1R3HFZ1_COCAP|nr:hypothetical protein CCACVL1_19573 [Corchorus capsularis]
MARINTGQAGRQLASVRAERS